MNGHRASSPVENSFQSNGDDSLISQEGLDRLRKKGAASAELPPIPPSPTVLSQGGKIRRASGSSASIKSIMGSIKRGASFEFLTRPTSNSGNIRDGESSMKQSPPMIDLLSKEVETEKKNLLTKALEHGRTVAKSVLSEAHGKTVEQNNRLILETNQVEKSDMLLNVVFVTVWVAYTSMMWGRVSFDKTAYFGGSFIVLLLCLGKTTLLRQFIAKCDLQPEEKYFLEFQQKQKDIDASFRGKEDVFILEGLQGVLTTPKHGGGGSSGNEGSAVPSPPPSEFTPEDMTTTEANYVDKQGFYLNAFKGLEAFINFEKDVLSKLGSAEQESFRSFADKFKAAYAANEECQKYSREIPDDFTMLRFLQADNYKEDAAVLRLMKTCVWFETSGYNKFVDNPDWRLLDRVRALRPRNLAGLDKNGNPLMIEYLGQFFGSDEAYKGVSFEDWLVTYSFLIGEILNVFRQKVKRGMGYHHRMSYIGDLSGIRIMTTVKLIPYLQRLVKEVETHFPELAGPIILFNTPSIINGCWQVVRKFLDPSVVTKIVMTSRSNPLDAFEDKLGLRVVPAVFGGESSFTPKGVPRRVDAEFDSKYPYVPWAVAKI